MQNQIQQQNLELPFKLLSIQYGQTMAREASKCFGGQGWWSRHPRVGEREQLSLYKSDSSSESETEGNKGENAQSTSRELSASGEIPLGGFTITNGKHFLCFGAALRSGTVTARLGLR